MKKSNKLSRRDFIKVTTAFGSGILLYTTNCKKGSNEKSFLSDIGVCTSIENHEILKSSGCTYIEEAVRRFLIPNESDEKFQVKMVDLKKSNLPVSACNNFIPGSLKSVGPETKHEEILSFTETAFKRAQQSGVKTIVFGSGGSRRIPGGFDKDNAKEQFIQLLERMAPIAGKYGVTISLEPLNSGETNFINNLSEGVEIVEAVNHPNFKLLADIYHMLREGETSEEIIKAGKHIYHCHIAEKEKRTPPGTDKDDFKPFLKALKEVNYKGRMSIECRWGNMEEQLPGAVEYLQKQISEIN